MVRSWADVGGSWADVGGSWADVGGLWADLGGSWAGVLGRACSTVERRTEFISARTSATNSEYLTHSLLSRSRAPINRTARAGPPTLTSEVCLPIAVRLG